MASRKFQDLNGCCSKVEGALSDLRQFLAIESPLKLWKMLFISPQKLFHSKDMTFGHAAKRLAKKDMVKFKFKTSQPS